MKDTNANIISKFLSDNYDELLALLGQAGVKKLAVRWNCTARNVRYRLGGGIMNPTPQEILDDALKVLEDKDDFIAKARAVLEAE